jgi:hypothetical protein
VPSAENESANSLRNLSPPNEKHRTASPLRASVRATILAHPNWVVLQISAVVFALGDTRRVWFSRRGATRIRVSLSLLVCVVARRNNGGGHHVCNRFARLAAATLEPATVSIPTFVVEVTSEFQVAAYLAATRCGVTSVVNVAPRRVKVRDATKYTYPRKRCNRKPSE